MRHQRLKSVHYFFTTAPLPCPYLPDRMERRVVTELSGRDVDSLHDALSLSGFRRSHGVAYAPSCSDCSACIPMRAVSATYAPTRTQRRIERKNAYLSWQECPAIATVEQYELFSAYQAGRHTGGEMAKMDFGDYQALVEDTPVESGLVEFRDGDGVLRAVCLADRLCDGLSAVYSFYDPAFERDSLGTYMVIWLIRRAHQLGLSYVYLGFWIAACSKMAYKSKFQPCEMHHGGSWVPCDGTQPPDTPEPSMPEMLAIMSPCAPSGGFG